MKREEIAASAASWDNELAKLRSRYPKASDGILFCVHKLQGNPELSIRDFRDEARLHGLGLSGRSVHSAKVLLGMEKPAGRRRRSPDGDSDVDHRGNGGSFDEVSLTGSVEETLIAAVQQLQESATAESNRLRVAIRSAMEILQRALDGRS